MKQTNLFTLLQSEQYKAKHNSGVLCVLFFPLLITLSIDFHLIYKSGELNEMYPENPWTSLLGYYIFNFYSLLYPIVISILCYSLCQMEYRNDNYKLLFTLPVRRIDLYLAKILYLIKIIFLSTLIAYFSYVGSGYLFELMIPAYSFQDYNVDSAIFMFFCKLFISLSAIALIQHSISLLFRQFVIPVGFGCFATLAGLIIMRVSWNDFIPYISVYKSYEGFFHEIDNPEKYDYINIGYCLIFLFIGYILFERNKGKSNL